jgi:phosphoribosylaminoimidazole-succinocarboxamide synthase
MKNLAESYSLGEKIASGKTKDIFETAEDPKLVIVLSKDDVTAGDGARHQKIVATSDHPGKGELSNIATCRMFEYFGNCGIPVAYIGQLDATSFLAKRCQMLPLEQVGRRYAYGSWLGRNPGIEKMTRFESPVEEIFLKTTGRQWQGKPLFCDDPLMDIKGEYALLYQPKLPAHDQLPIFLEDYPLKNSPGQLIDAKRIQAATFLAWERAWKELGYLSIDLKIETGLTADRWVVLADVVDGDSGRVLDADGNHIDKQFYRDSDDSEDVLNRLAYKYQLIARASESIAAITPMKAMGRVVA